MDGFLSSESPAVSVSMSWRMESWLRARAGEISNAAAISRRLIGVVRERTSGKAEKQVEQE